MSHSFNSVPTPDLRIIHALHIHPHEEHDSQRALPLIQRLQNAEFLTNPPIVAPMHDDHFVVLDGANRYHSLCHLGYEHILAQVAPYDTGFVDLHVWQHIISDWNIEDFLRELQQLTDVTIAHGWDSQAIARILLKNGQVLSLDAITNDLILKNQTLRKIVKIYQNNARLDRTALEDTAEIWQLYPQAIALVRFPHYQPHDIMQAASQKAYLPPGISRHIVHGRALQLNYPLSELRNLALPIDEKNRTLQQWLQNKFAQRSVRFYAESTYQFSE